MAWVLLPILVSPKQVISLKLTYVKPEQLCMCERVSITIHNLSPWPVEFDEVRWVFPPSTDLAGQTFPRQFVLTPFGSLAISSVTYTATIDHVAFSAKARILYSEQFVTIENA
jgi:hypothetical protein